jgi:hypothetical protein
MKESDMKEVTVQRPIGERVTYKTFPQDSVDCIIKKHSGLVLKRLLLLKFVSRI